MRGEDEAGGALIARRRFGASSARSGRPDRPDGFAAELKDTETLSSPTVQVSGAEYVFDGAVMVPLQPRDMGGEPVAGNPAAQASGTQVIFWLEWTGALEKPSTPLRRYEVLVTVQTNTGPRIPVRPPLIVEKLGRGLTATSHPATA